MSTYVGSGDDARARPAGTLRLLLIEDDSSDVEMLRLITSRAVDETFELERFERLAPALAALRDAPRRADAVLLDLAVPDATGLEGLSQLVALTPSLPVIVLTGTRDDSLASEALTKDAQDCLTKWEFDAHQLSRTIRNAIDRHQLRTELRSAKERAEYASRLKSEFLANVSHEIRTPIHTMLGMADVLLTTPLSTTQRDQLVRLLHAAQHLHAIIEDVLDMSRIENGRFDLEAAPFALTELIEGAVELTQPLAAAKGLELTATLSADVPRAVSGDISRLRQILVNLLGNAVKFTERGRIVLSVSCARRHDDVVTVRFTVADTGIGIPHDKLVSVFEPFSQADDSTSHRFGGSGLGLAITAHLVQLMSGNITVRSEPGLGTTFQVEIPLPVSTIDTRPRGERPTPVGEASLRTRTDPLRLLLVDDSEDSRFVIGAYLQGVRAEIREVDNAEAAIAAFSRARFDLALVDMHLAGTDGVEVVRRMRAIEGGDPTRERTPILAFSADARREAITRAEDAGCDAYLTKPMRRSVLLEAVARFGAFSGHVRPAGRTELLAPILPRFFAHRARDLDAMRTAVAERDYATLSTLGHNMKGSGAPYGFPVLSHLGARIESAAAARDTALLDHLIDDFDRTLARIVATSSRSGSGVHKAASPAGEGSRRGAAR